MLIGVSVVQDGSGYPYFAPSTFSYLCHMSTHSIIATPEDIPDAKVQQPL